MSILKIVIDGRMFQQSGIGRYIRNLVANLQIIDKKNEYFILHLKDDYETIEYNDNFHKVLANFRWYGASEQIQLLKLLKSLRADLVHFPHFNIPILYRGKFIVTIHDLIHQHFSMERATTRGPVLYTLKQAGYQIVFKVALSKSLKILVPSNFVEGELTQDWQIDAGKIVVTPEAVDDKISMIINKMSAEDISRVKRRLGIKHPFLFYVGNAHPHKNVEGLIRVFREFGEDPHLSLVLAGYDHYFWQRIKKMYKLDSIIYTGEVSDEELVALYKTAQCLIMPSLEEGFGIPILEAMACSCPVVSSCAGSLPEVGGDAVVYFDPGNVKDMRKKIDQVLKSEELRKDLIAKGRVRVRAFSWKKLAKQTSEVYEQCA